MFSAPVNVAKDLKVNALPLGVSSQQSKGKEKLPLA
jgi:hypothetical protein